jgi:hypothetical protein
MYDEIISDDSDMENIEATKETTEMNPEEYFDFLKDKTMTVDEEYLRDFYYNCLSLVDKYKTTGQTVLLRKIQFLVSCIEDEYEIAKMGINRFVYRDDIEDYIDKVSKGAVRIIELQNYPRDIPNEIVEIVAKTKDIFDCFYVVYTDYSGKITRDIEREKRKKDPILFGTFQRRNPDGRSVDINDRFYYIGDWIDEYCDLTLDKFLNETSRNNIHETMSPKKELEILEELEKVSQDLREQELPIRIQTKKINIWYKIKEWFNANK